MFVFTDYDRSIALAKASDARRARGESLGPFDGIPFAAKDIYCMENVPTTASSRILEGKDQENYEGLAVFRYSCHFFRFYSAVRINSHT